MNNNEYNKIAGAKSYNTELARFSKNMNEAIAVASKQYELLTNDNTLLGRRYGIRLFKGNADYYIQATKNSLRLVTEKVKEKVLLGEIPFPEFIYSFPTNKVGYHSSWFSFSWDPGFFQNKLIHQQASKCHLRITVNLSPSPSTFPYIFKKTPKINLCISWQYTHTHLLAADYYFISSKVFRKDFVDPDKINNLQVPYNGINVSPKEITSKFLEGFSSAII